MANASPDTRCELAAAGLSRALPSCVATDGDAVLTLTQLLVEPRLTHAPTSIRLTLDPEAPLEYDADRPWSEQAAALARHDGEHLWI